MPRILTALVTVAFFIATTVYAAHLHDRAGKKDGPAHCEICLQLSGTAGTPPPVRVTKPIPTVTPDVTFVRIQPSITTRVPSAHRSRAPPSRGL